MNLAEAQVALKELHISTGASHYHSSLSALPVLLAIKAKMKDGDRCVLSKAHAITAYNLVFGIEMANALAHSELASLGMGISFAMGIAKVRPEITVFVVCGDGEMQEGATWEAMYSMVRQGITNVEVHVDVNGMQACGECPLLSLPVIHHHRTYKGPEWRCHYESP